MGSQKFGRLFLCAFALLLSSKVDLGLASGDYSVHNTTSSQETNSSSNSHAGEMSALMLEAVRSHVTISDRLRATELSTSQHRARQDTSPDSTRGACSRDLTRLSKAILSGELWSILFVDSSGKPGPSLSKGWLDFIGNYDQCQQAAAPVTALAPGFKGNYYALTFSTGIPLLTSRLDLCLPDSCTETEIASIAAVLLNTSTNTLGLGVISVECINNETEVTAATVFCIVILSILVCLVLLGTAFELVSIRDGSSGNDGLTGENGGLKLNDEVQEEQSYESISGASECSTSKSNTVCHNAAEEKTFVKSFVTFCLAFSVYGNGKALLKSRTSQNSLSCLHGLRFLSCCWIVLCHTCSYLLELRVPLNMNSKLFDLKDRWTFGPAANAFISVDTFFAVSGLLVAYHTLNEINKKGWKIDWARFYLHRYWRLTPPYMLVLLTSLGLTQYLGEGSLWLNKQPIDKDKCEDSWWKNLLYINNFDYLNEQCMEHGWYLACNMQYHLLSPLVIVPFYFHQAAGIASCSVFLLTSWIVTGVLSSASDWTTNGSLDFDSLEEKNEWTGEFYVKPWCRIGPFMVGVIAGYILTQTKGKSFKIQWWVVALGWLMSTVTALAVVYGLHGDISGRHPSSTGVAALYNSVARSAWGVSICWIILACDAGYGGPVNAILSWSPFVVLGRLSYMMYLIHPYVIRIVYENMGALLFYTDYTLTTIYLGFVSFTAFASFFLVLVLESPMGRLEELYIPKGKKKRFI